MRKRTLWLTLTRSDAPLPLLRKDVLAKHLDLLVQETIKATPKILPLRDASSSAAFALASSSGSVIVVRVTIVVQLQKLFVLKSETTL